jgi:hypothetical protein
MKRYLQLIFSKQGARICTGFKQLKMVASGRVVWTQQLSFRLLKWPSIPWRTKRLRSTLFFGIKQKGNPTWRISQQYGPVHFTYCINTATREQKRRTGCNSETRQDIPNPLLSSREAHVYLLHYQTSPIALLRRFFAPTPWTYSYWRLYTGCNEILPLW